MQQFAKPLEQATTSSLEALQEYSLGEDETSQVTTMAAIPHLKRAVEIDPIRHGLGHDGCILLSNLGRNTEGGAQALKKAL